MIACVQANPKIDLNKDVESYITQENFDELAGLTFNTFDADEVTGFAYFFQSRSGSRSSAETDTGILTFWFYGTTEGQIYNDLQYTYNSDSGSFHNENQFFDPIPGTTDNWYYAWGQQMKWVAFDSDLFAWTWWISGENHQTAQFSASHTILTDGETSTVTDSDETIEDGSGSNSSSGLGIPDWVHISEVIIPIDSGASGYTTIWTTGEYWIPSVNIDGNFLYTSVVVDSWTTTTASAYCTVAGKSIIYFADPTWPYEMITVYQADFNALQCDQIFVPPDDPPLDTPTVWEDILIDYGNIYYRYPRTSQNFIIWALVNSGPGEPAWTIPAWLDQPDLVYDVPAITSYETYAGVGYSEGYLPMDSYTYATGYDLVGTQSSGIDALPLETTTVIHAWDTEGAIGPVFGAVPDLKLFTWNDVDGFHYFEYNDSSLAKIGDVMGVGPMAHVILTAEDEHNTVSGYHVETVSVLYPATYITGPRYYFYNIVPIYKNGFQIAPQIVPQGMSPVFKGVGAEVAMPWYVFYGALAGAGIAIPFEMYYEGDEDVDGIGGSSFEADGIGYLYSFGTSDTGVPMYLTTYLVDDPNISQEFTNHLFGIGGIESVYRTQAGGVGLPAAPGPNTIVIWGSYNVTDCDAAVTWQQSYQNEINIGEGQLSLFAGIDINVFITDPVPGAGIYDLNPVAFDLYPGGSQNPDPNP